jgi:hypothetical protein
MMKGGSAPTTVDSAVVRHWAETALARPLFRENRRPEDASNGRFQQRDETARLAGILTGPFGNRAIFMEPADNAKPMTLVEGERVGSLLVRSIQPGRVIVEIDGTVRTLTPAFAAAAPVATRTGVNDPKPGTRSARGSSYEG